MICECGVQDGSWLAELIPHELVATIFLYDVCDPRTSLPNMLSTAAFRDRCAQADGKPLPDTRPDCPGEVILQHMLRHAADGAEFLAYLPSIPPNEYEQHLYSMAFKSLAKRSLSVEFLALGHSRTTPRVLDPCQRVMLTTLGINGHAAGYDAPRFLASAARVSKSLEQARAINVSLATSDECKGRTWTSVMRGLWHTVFGEVALQPTRADNTKVPSFLRVLDGPSGFANSRMPKSSDYLSWAARGLSHA